MDEITPFAYKDLPSGCIRLLTPDLSDDADGYSWRLEVVPLGQPDLAFEALSYVWGPQDETYAIRCNGKALHVHYNLFTALPFLSRRSTQPVLPIWIDAVCIDQDDVEERSAQIRSMGQLYRTAKKVWAWLGIAEHQELIPEAVEILSHMAAIANQYPTETRIPTEVQAGLNLHNAHLKMWDTLLHLVDNDWYHRVWIVQEASLAQDIELLCGDYKANFSMVATVTERVGHFTVFHESDHGRAMAYIVHQKTQLFRIRNLMTLAEDSPQYRLLKMTLLTNTGHGCRCLQPEDRILGIMGLFDDSAMESIGASSFLHASTVQELYTRFSAYLLSCPTRILPRSRFWWGWLGCAFSYMKMEGLPSWVPDFHHQGRGYTPQPYKYLSRFLKYQASTRESYDEDCESLHNGQLMIKGKLLDEVIAVYPELLENPKFSRGYATISEQGQFITSVAEWEVATADAVLTRKTTDGVSKGYESNEQSIPLDMYWRTLIGNWTMGPGGPITRDWYLSIDAAMKEVAGWVKQLAMRVVGRTNNLQQAYPKGLV